MTPLDLSQLSEVDSLKNQLDHHAKALNALVRWFTEEIVCNEIRFAEPFPGEVREFVVQELVENPRFVPAVRGGPYGQRS